MLRSFSLGVALELRESDLYTDQATTSAVIIVIIIIINIIMSMELAYNASSASTSPPVSFGFTNTAKLPIETVKRLIAAVSRRPVLWLRNNASGQKRSDITPIWFDVGKDVNLPGECQQQQQQLQLSDCKPYKPHAYKMRKCVTYSMRFAVHVHSVHSIRRIHTQLA